MLGAVLKGLGSSAKAVGQVGASVARGAGRAAAGTAGDALTAGRRAITPNLRGALHRMPYVGSIMREMGADKEEKISGKHSKGGSKVAGASLLGGGEGTAKVVSVLEAILAQVTAINTKMGGDKAGKRFAQGNVDAVVKRQEEIKQADAEQTSGGGRGLMGRMAGMSVGAKAAGGLTIAGIVGLIVLAVTSPKAREMMAGMLKGFMKGVFGEENWKMFTDAIDTLTGAVGTVVDFFKSFGEKIGDAIGYAVDSVLSIIPEFIGGDTAKNAKKRLKDHPYNKPEEKPAAKPAEKGAAAPAAKTTEKPTAAVTPVATAPADDKQVQKAEKAAVKAEVKAAEPVPVPPKPAAPVATPVPPVAPKPAPAATKQAAPPVAGPGSRMTPEQQKMAEGLRAAGFTDDREIANVMAQVQHESGFKSQDENLGKYTAKNLFSMYGEGNKSGNKVRFKSMEEAQAVVSKGPEAVGNVIYGGRMGNKEDEGYKYRGRGLIQLTGKDNYKKYGKLIGVDLVSTPDLASDPDVAQKIAVAYFQEKKKKGVNLADINATSKVVGHAGGAAQNEAREKTANLMLASLSGDKLKANSSQAAAPTVNINNTNVNAPKTTMIAAAGGGGSGGGIPSPVADRSVYQKYETSVGAA